MKNFYPDPPTNPDSASMSIDEGIFQARVLVDRKGQEYPVSELLRRCQQNRESISLIALGLIKRSPCRSYTHEDVVWIANASLDEIKTKYNFRDERVAYNLRHRSQARLKK